MLMPDWNSSPPRGHPMEPGKWPGTPLYPPSAAPGHTPSKDSDLVIAVKRATAHIGAFPWDPPAWDDSYNEKIAAAVKDVQRWSGTLEPTGFFGEKSFNFYRSVLMGDSRPNAGQPAWDATCVALTESAYLAAHPPASTRPRRDVALDHMAARLGYTEDPANSNCDNRSDGIRTAQDHCADGTWLRYEPWCGCWCFYALEAAGVQHIDSHLASVAQIEDYARAGSKCYRGWTTDRSRVKAGDLTVIGGYGQHVEMVRGTPTSSSTPTYGGNTSPGTSGSQSNGGGAYARTRYPSEVRGYALVRYPDD